MVSIIVCTVKELGKKFEKIDPDESHILTIGIYAIE
jgi:hypothetical protein